MSGAVARVLDKQQRWAADRGVVHDEQFYTLSLDDNLFRPLHPATRGEFERGKGDETRHKLRSLRSSSALVCNVFDYWRGVGAGAIAEASLAFPGSSRLCFERQLPGLRVIGPHLDVEISGDGVPPTGVESKFLEPYSSKKVILKHAYLRTALWDGMPRCLELTEAVSAGRLTFGLLNVLQLLAHILGLVAAYGRGNFRLVYLWFDVGGPEGDQHREEIDRFRRLIGADVDFQPTTHQQVFERLRLLAPGHPEYYAYLTERYFAA